MTKLVYAAGQNHVRCACWTAEGGRPHTIFAPLGFLELLLLHTLVDNHRQVAAYCAHCCD